MCLRTFVAVDEGILDNHSPAICCSKLLCLAPRFPETARIPQMTIWSRATWYAQDMAREEVFGTAEIDIRGVRFFVARG